MYELGGNVRSFSFENGFTTTLSKVAYKWGQTLTPFCIYADEYQQGVLDVTSFSGLEGKGLLVDEVFEARKAVFEQEGIRITDAMKKAVFLQYLLTVSVCYVEIEKWKTQLGVPTPTYDKGLYTRSPRLMAAWMGSTEGQMISKYSAKLRTTSFELGEGTLRAVRLNQSAKGNSITMPRSPLEVSKIKVIPLFMLYAFTQGFKGVLNEGLLEFTFLKDNHTERVMTSTLSSDVLYEVYKDNGFVAKMLSGVDIETVDQGGMMLPSKIHRGYIKVPEVGIGRYDETGTRSLNLARIIKIRKVNLSDLQLDYIDVDLEKVVDSFLNSAEYVLKNMPERLQEVYRLVGDSEKDISGLDGASLMNEISNCVESGVAMLTTQYKRDLHMVAIQHPDLFPLYNATGGSGVRGTDTSYGIGGELDF